MMQRQAGAQKMETVKVVVTIPPPSRQMVEAATAALLAWVPEDFFDGRTIDPETVAEQVIRAALARRD